MKHIDAGFFIRLFGGLFLISLGIIELNAQSSFLQGVFRGVALPFGSGAGVLNTVASLIELAGGITLITTLFTHIRVSLYRFIVAAALLVWLARIVYQYLLTGFLEPDLLLWVKSFSIDAMFAGILWLLFGDRSL